MTENEQKIYSYLLARPFSYVSEIARDLYMSELWAKNNVKNMVRKDTLVEYEASWSGVNYYRVKENNNA